MSPSWNADERALAEQMWAGGVTGQKIAEHFGITRNAAIGRLNRKGAVGTGKHGGQRKAKSPAPPPSPNLPRRERTKTAATTGDLAEGQCKWPLNDGNPRWLHCGAKAVSDSPYCEAHERKSRNPARGERNAK